MKTLLASTWTLSLALYVISPPQGQSGGPPSLPSTTQCSVPSDDRAIGDIPERWRAAYNGGQASQVGALYTEDAYYLTQHFVSGIMHGKADIQSYVQQGVDADTTSTRSRYSQLRVPAMSHTPSPAISLQMPAGATSA